MAKLIIFIRGCLNGLCVLGQSPVRVGFVFHKRPTESKIPKIVADRSGSAVPYALFNLEPRGRLFVVPGGPVYEGLLIGEHNREIYENELAMPRDKLISLKQAGVI